MGCDPKFRKKLEKAIVLALRELRDGCNDCRVCGSYCNAHEDEAHNIAFYPRQSKAVQEILGLETKNPSC